MSGDLHLPAGYPECGGLDAYGAERDLLIDIDDDGAKRVVVDGKVVLDEISAKALYDATFFRSTDQQARELRQSAKHAQVARWLKVVRRKVDRPRIQHPPAYALDRFLRNLVSRKSYERVFSQVIIDTREEYFEALAAGRIAKGRWILVRCYLSVAWTWFLLTPGGVTAAIVKRLSGS